MAKPTASANWNSHAFVEEFSIDSKGIGALTGLTCAVKDLIDVAGYKTGCGNPTWTQQHPPASTHALCVDQLLYAGAKCIGKTVTSQFAFDLIGENIFFPTPLNPKTPERVPGGSSNGSASVVACGLADFSLGTDTGGSVRVPASNCGIFGMRPSHNIISVAGIMPFSPTFDTVGIFSKSFEILHRVASILLSLPTVSSSNPFPRQIYLIEEAFAEVDPICRQALNSITQLLDDKVKLNPISIREIDQESSLIGMENWYKTYTTIQYSEIWSCLGSWMEEYQPELGEVVKASFQLAKECDRSKLQQALRQREFYFNRLHTFLGAEDLICIPTVPTFAPLKLSLDPDRKLGIYYYKTLALNSIAGICRLPQISVPCIEIEGKPLGLSFLSAHRSDLFLLQTLQNLLPLIF